MNSLRKFFIFGALLVFGVLQVFASGEVRGDGTNGLFITEQGGNLGYAELMSDNDHIYGQKSVRFTFSAWQSAYVIFTKTLTQGVSRGSYTECRPVNKLVSLTPLVGNVYIKTTFYISGDGVNFCEVAPVQNGVGTVGDWWVPQIIQIQGQNPPSTVTAIRMRFDLYFNGNPASDSIRAQIKWDYWTFSFGAPFTIVDDFEGGLVGINSNTETPEKYSLSQNYPNPFNPVTRIEYSVPKRTLVNLTVYDVLGREVQTLVNEVKSQGNYSVNFNGSNLSSGAYFYRIKTEGFVDTKKMILIK